jgi:hypothetical protein
MQQNLLHAWDVSMDWGLWCAFVHRLNCYRVTKTALSLRVLPLSMHVVHCDGTAADGRLVMIPGVFELV